MAGRRFLYSIGLIGAAVFYLMYQKWFSWIVLIVVLMIPWFSLLISLWAMITFRAKLIAPGKIIAGSQAPVQLKTESSSVHPPVTCRIRITKKLTGESWTAKNGDSLPTNHCGTLEIRAERLHIYDYMGLFRRRIRRIPGVSVRVMPQPAAIVVPEDLSRFLAHAWHPKAGGGYAENHEIRPYHPGDTLNLVHWKLSAKVDSLMLREPMEPEQVKVILKMDLCGTPDELDRKLGRLLWMGNWLLERQVSFSVLALTGKGIETWFVPAAWALDACMSELLSASCCKTGSVRERECNASWQIWIGGETDEA